MWFEGKALDSHGKGFCVINRLDTVFSSPKYAPVNWLVSSGVKRLRRVDDQSVPSSVEVKEGMELSSFVLYAFMACTGPPLPLCLTFT
jgi:hypothetical protein